MLTTLTGICLAANATCASSANETSEPVAINIALGFSPESGSLKMYAPLVAPIAELHLLRSKTGKFCLESSNPAGLAFSMICPQH